MLFFSSVFVSLRATNAKTMETKEKPHNDHPAALSDCVYSFAFLCFSFMVINETSKGKQNLLLIPTVTKPSFDW